MPTSRSADSCERLEERRQFAEQAVLALRELEQQKPSTQGTKLALKAHSALQWDLPMLTVRDLEALTALIRSALEVKGSIIQLPPMTAKLVSNITAGALTHAGKAAAAGLQEDGPDRGPLLLAARADGPLLAAAYQRLCCAVLLHFGAAVLGAPPSEALYLLASYHLSPPSQSKIQHSLTQDEQPTRIAAAEHASSWWRDSLSEPSPNVPDLGNRHTQHLASTGHAQQDAEQTDMFLDVYSNVQDSDDMDAYEPLESVVMPTPIFQPLPQPLALLTAQPGLPVTSPGIDLLVGGNQAWCTCLDRILHLLSAEHFAALAAMGPPGKAASVNLLPPPNSTAVQDIWADPATAAALLCLLRLLGVHDHAADMLPVQHAVLDLLIEHMVQSSDTIEQLIPSVLEALGIGRIAGMPPARPRPASSLIQAGQPVLLREAGTALALIMKLADKLPAGSQGLAALWRQVHSRLLPVVARCVADVQAAGLDHPQAVEALHMPCEVLLLYLTQRPGGTNPWQALQSAGVVRQLASLLAKQGWAGHASAESFRKATLLLCAAAGAQQQPPNGGTALQWMLAVPGVCNSLASQAFLACGVAEAHGLVWQWLRAQPIISSQVSPATEIHDHSGFLSLEELLQGEPSFEQVSRLHACLELMASMHAVCDKRVQWADLEGQMRAAWPLLKARAALHTLRSDPDELEVPGEGPLAMQKLAGAAEPATLWGVLKQQQLERQCLGHLKALVMTASKGD